MGYFGEFKVHSLARTVLEIESNIKDYLEVAVIIEALGYSDKKAKEYGHGNIFDLAKRVCNIIDYYRVRDNFKVDPVKKERSGMFRLFFSGLFYNLAWITMLIALFLGGLSAWAGIDLPIEVSTSMGLGVILGLIVTGGIQQFSSWKIIFYESQGNDPLVRFITKKSYLIGGLAIASISISIYVLNHFVLFFPSFMAQLTVFYLLLMGTYRLLVIPTFALRKYRWLISSSAVTIVVLFMAYFSLISTGFQRVSAVIVSQFLAVASASFVNFCLSYDYIFNRKGRNAEGDETPPFYARPVLPTKVKPPRLSILVYEGLPYLAYGSLYFIFLFADRLISWLGGPYGLYYNRVYQMSSDMALLVLIPITGVKFYFIHGFSKFLEEKLEEMVSTRTKNFVRCVSRFYRKMSLWVLLFGIASAVIMLSLESVILRSATTESINVFRWALLGNLFFAIFLSNTLFCFLFRRTKAIVFILALGSIVNYTSSYVLSTTFTFWYAVFGYLISTILLCLVSAYYTVKLIRNVDYVYFSAF